MPSYPDDVNPGQFVGTTQIYDLNKENLSETEFTTRLRQNFNNIVMALNVKDSGYYSQEEFVNGQLYFPDYSRSDSANSTPPLFRQVFRKVINTGTLPNAGTATIAHGITFLPTAGNTTFIATRIYGAATDQANRIMLPLPYASPTLNQNISVYVDATNIYITTGIDRTAFTVSQVVVEFLKY